MVFHTPDALAAARTADVFISRAGPDAPVARMIASIIRKASKTPFYQDEDFNGQSFMRLMEAGYDVPRTVALLSPAYQNSEHCRKEYNHHLADDPGNIRRRLVVFRIGDARPTGNLKDIGYVDLLRLLAPLDANRLAKVVRVALGLSRRARRSTTRASSCRPPRSCTRISAPCRAISRART
jgi:hypothetical protein